MYVAGKLHSWEINQVRQFDEQGSFIAGRTHGFSPEATTRGNRMTLVVDPKTIELYGGPFDGKTHEILDPFDIGLEPAEIGLPISPPAEDPKAWYARGADGQYRFVSLR
jgi:hypothetical protein